MRYLISLLILLTCSAQAQTYQIQHNGAPQFSANCLVHEATSPVWDFRDSCGQPPPPPSGRQTVGRVAYQSSGIVVRDLTQWNSVFGHATVDDAVIAWPGRHNSQPTIVDFRRGSYVALQVQTNSLGQIPTFGFVGSTEYNRGFDPAVSWSRTAGDFSTSLGVNCYNPRVRSGGQLIAYATPLTGYAASCHLPPNATVFFNIKMADPAQVTPLCAATSPTCPFGMNNNFN